MTSTIYANYLKLNSDQLDVCRNMPNFIKISQVVLLWGVAVFEKKLQVREFEKKITSPKKGQNFSKSENCEIFSKFGNSIKRGVNGGSKNDSLKVGQL